MNLNRAQINAVLEAFSAADWKRANVIAAFFCQGLVGMNANDLLQETLVKFLEGNRVWPAGEHPLVVLKTAMHSVSSNARKRNARSPIDAATVVAPLQSGAGDESETTVEGVMTITPEDELSGKQQIVAVYAALGGDEELETLTLAWSDGLRGNDAMQELGWESKKYDAVRKRLMRRLDALK